MYLIIHCTPAGAGALEPAIRNLALLSHQLPETEDHLTAAPTPAAVVAEAIAALDENAAPGENNAAARHMPQALRLLRQRPSLLRCARNLLLEYQPPETATCILQKDAATLAEHLLDAASAEDRNRLKPDR